MKKFTKVGLGLAAVAATVAAGAFVTSAFGPSGRATFTLKKPATYVTFNSITDNTNFGNELYFVSASPYTGDPTKNHWTDQTEVENGKEYVIRMYVHNNAAENLNLVARDVTAHFNVPTETGTEIKITGQLSSSNANPTKYWDETYLKSKNGEKFNLAYVQGSAKYFNNAKPEKNGGFAIDWKNLTSTTGVKLGYEKMDGNIPGCFQYAGYLTFRVKAQFASQPDLSITKEVKMLGTNTWNEKIKVKGGDTVRYRIHVKNTGNVRLEDVAVRDLLPEGLTYVKGSTTVINSYNPKGITVSDNIITKAGINIGNYAVKGDAYIYFNATVNKALSDKCGNSTLRNIAQTSAGTNTGTKEDIADVIVEGKVCNEGFTIDKKVKRAADGQYVENTTLKAGETAHYRIAFKNTGGVTLKNVIIKDTLPANMTYVKGSTKIDSTAAADGIISANGLNIGNVAAGKTVYVYFDATVAKALGDKCETTTLTNTVKGTYNKDDKTAKTDTAVVKIEGKICQDGFTIDKKVLDSRGNYVETTTLKAGETAHYRIAFKNVGDNELKNVVIKDTLPAKMTYVAGSTKVDGKSVADGIISDNGINIGSVAAGKTVYIYFDAKVNAGVGQDCASVTLTNVVKGKYNNDEKTAKTDTAIVTVDAAECNEGFTINKMVQLNGGNSWSENIVVKAGDKVRYRIQFKNTGDKTLKNVVIRDILPAHMTYVKGTTVLYNSANTNGKTLADGIISADGINIGDYAKGAEATIYFYATVNASLKDNCNDSTLTNTVKGKYNNDAKTEKSDTAKVTVKGKECKETPIVPELPNTGAGEVLSGIIGLAAMTTAAGYYVNSRKK